jgi:L-alanine-DL-glutamate epimerase-like enolase superfamily enzyme
VGLYDAVRDLPLLVDTYGLESLEQQVSSGFLRKSTVIRLSGAGEEGLGEDVTYEATEHDLVHAQGPIHSLAGEWTVATFSDQLATLTLFDHEPEQHAYHDYRRWAYESAALDLALRQSGVSLHEALGRDPKPVNFVCSTRLSGFGDDSRSTTDPVRRRLDKYPTLRFKLDPENDWDAELIAELAEIAGVDVLDLKGLYRGTPVDVETDPELYRAVAEAFPSAYLEDPDLNDETRPVLEPHADRVTWDAALHSLADLEGLEREPRTINSKPSRFGSLDEVFAVYEHCGRQRISIYGGGQGELGPGRGQVQYLASLFHPDTPNDIAPSGYNDPAVPDGMPSSPLEPAPSATGFRWGEWADR